MKAATSDNIVDWECLTFGLSLLSLCSIFADLREAQLESFPDFVPVMTFIPDEKISRVVSGSRLRTITAAKRLGLYFTLRARRAKHLKSS